MSHLATPEDIAFTDMQLETFQLFQSILTSLNIYPKYTHICASG